MMDDFLSNLPDFHPITPRKGEKWSWWRLTLVVAFFVGLSVGIVFLLRFIEGFLKRPLEGFAVYAYIIVFFVSLLSSSTILLPAPGLLIVLTAASRWNPTWVAIAASLGSTLGETTSYLAGYWGSKVVVKKESRLYARAERWMKRYGMFAVIFVAFVPFTAFDLVGIFAGVLRLPYWKFLLAVYIGRIPRAFIETYGGGGLLKHFFGG